MKYVVSGSSASNYLIDLMMVRDDNRVVSVLGAGGPQIVPAPGDVVPAEDEDGNVYDAHVESVLADGRVYLRVVWSSQRQMRNPTSELGMIYSPTTSLAPALAARG